MSYSDSFPAVSPQWQCNFAANGGRLEPRMNYSRASSGTFFGTEKVLTSENLILQSENFTTTWTIQDASGAAGATAPDGGTDGYTVTAHSGSSKGPRASQSLSGKLSTSTQYTMVGHVKAGTATHGFISFRGNNSNNYAYAQIQFSSPGSVSTGGAGFSAISGTVTALNSSWYKLTLTATTGSDVSGAFAFVGLNDGTAFGISGYPAWTSAGETLEIWGAQLSSINSKVYDSPTTTQIARNYQTKLQTAASGAARFEHSATDGQSAGTSLGILVESQSTNLLNRSEEFDNAYWSKLNTTVAANAAIAPNGELTADLVTADSTGSAINHNIAKAYAFTSGNTYTLSVYAKAYGALSRLRLRAGNPATWAAQTTFILSGSGSMVGNDYGTAQIQPCGNGWYRCSITGTAGASATTNLLFTLENSDGNTSFDGDGFSGAILYGAQLEESSHSSSYLKVEGSTATRAADSLSVTDASLFNTGTGGLVVEAVVKSLNDGVAAWLGTDGNNYHQVGQFGSTTYPLISKADGVASAVLSSSAVSTGAAHKVAASWDTNDFAGCVDGGTVVTDTSGTLPAVNKLTVGNYNAAAAWLDGHVKRVAVYNEALTDTNLQALTS